MVGRAAELDRLVGLLGARSTPRVALVAGGAGIGKTRLSIGVIPWLLLAACGHVGVARKRVMTTRLGLVIWWSGPASIR
jgi:hypothetical protein